MPYIEGIRYISDSDYPSLEAEIKDLAKKINDAIKEDNEGKSGELIYKEELEKFINSLNEEINALVDGISMIRDINNNQINYKPGWINNSLRIQHKLLTALSKEKVKPLKMKSLEAVQPIEQTVSLKSSTRGLISRYMDSFDFYLRRFSENGNLFAFETACGLIAERLDNPQIAINRGRIMRRVGFIDRNRANAVQNIFSHCRGQCVNNNVGDGAELFREALQSQIKKMNKDLTAYERMGKLAPKHGLEKSDLSLRPEELTAYRQLKEEFETVLNELNSSIV